MGISESRPTTEQILTTLRNKRGPYKQDKKSYKMCRKVSHLGYEAEARLEIISHILDVEIVKAEAGLTFATIAQGTRGQSDYSERRLLLKRESSRLSFHSQPLEWIYIELCLLVCHWLDQQGFRAPGCGCSGLSGVVPYAMALCGLAPPPSPSSSSPPPPPSSSDASASSPSDASSSESQPQERKVEVEEEKKEKPTGEEDHKVDEQRPANTGGRYDDIKPPQQLAIEDDKLEQIFWLLLSIIEWGGGGRFFFEVEGINKEAQKYVENVAMNPDLTMSFFYNLSRGFLLQGETQLRFWDYCLSWGWAGWMTIVAAFIRSLDPVPDFEDTIQKFRSIDVLTLLPGAAHFYHQHASEFDQIWNKGFSTPYSPPPSSRDDQSSSAQPDADRPESAPAPGSS